MNERDEQRGDDESSRSPLDSGLLRREPVGQGRLETSCGLASLNVFERDPSESFQIGDRPNQSPERVGDFAQVFVGHGVGTVAYERDNLVDQPLSRPNLAQLR